MSVFYEGFFVDLSVGSIPEMFQFQRLLFIESIHRFDYNNFLRFWGIFNDGNFFFYSAKI